MKTINRPITKQAKQPLAMVETVGSFRFLNCKLDRIITLGMSENINPFQMPLNLETISLTFSLLQPELTKKRLNVITRTIIKTTNSPMML